MSTRKAKSPAKDEIAAMPPFLGLTLAQIFVPESDVEFAVAAREILAAGVVGFDTESKPTFARGEESGGPHVVQFALADKAYLFLLHKPACRPYLLDILQSGKVLKAGFGLQSDVVYIRNRLGVELCSVLDLNVPFRKAGYEHTTGVRSAVAILFGLNFKKSKSVTTSNWSLPVLSDKQRLYAANDAYAALCVMQALESGATLG